MASTPGRVGAPLSVSGTVPIISGGCRGSRAGSHCSHWGTRGERRSRLQRGPSDLRWLRGRGRRGHHSRMCLLGLLCGGPPRVRLLLLL